MRKKAKKIIHFTTLALLLACAGVLGLVFAAERALPDTFQVVKGGTLSLQSPMHVTATYARADDRAVRAEQLSSGQYRVDLKLFGVIPIKLARVQTVDAVRVIPCGTPFGIKIFTQGVLIVGMTDVDSGLGLINPAKNAGLKEGDLISKINGVPVNTNEDVARMIEASGGNAVELTVTRKNMSFTVSFTPAKSKLDGSYKAGMWVRDSSAGIGTLTFYEPNRGVAAGLGHGVCDVDTGELLPLMSGEIVGAEITGTVKGQKGTPGELRGRFAEHEPLGQLLANLESGVYARYTGKAFGAEPIPLAMRQEVRQGAAQILTTVDGSGPQYYDCVIERVHFNDDSPTKNMILRITDPVLLEKTGGIVQGMSGSPIVQDGKLAGAVTHVFLSDPTQGYGIFAENMYFTAESVNQREFFAAS